MMLRQAWRRSDLQAPDPSKGPRRIGSSRPRSILSLGVGKWPSSCQAPFGQRSHMTTFLEKLGVALPIIQGPMAGGPDTPELAAAVSEAGGIGSLGCAYLSSERIEAAT